MRYAGTRRSECNLLWSVPMFQAGLLMQGPDAASMQAGR